MSRYGMLAMCVWLTWAVPGGLDAQDLTEAKRIQIAERLKRSTVVIEVGDGTGSGFIAGKERWIVTNAHVIQGYRRLPIEVRYGDGNKDVARVIAIDRKVDLAVLEARNRPSQPALRLADPKTVRVGQNVLAFGNPYGLEGTLTQGIVSARRDIGEGDELVRGVIQTDAPINPGNSGGPLVDSRGRVIGVNTGILSLSGGSQGIGFALPSNHVRAVLAYARKAEKGRAHEQALVRAGGWLGIYGSDFDAPGVRGVQVREVIPGSPAAEAGILGHDDPAPNFVRELGIPWTGHIIVAIDDTPVRSMHDLVKILRRRQPGEDAKLSLTLGPGAVEGQANVRLGKPPAAAAPIKP